MVPKEIKNKIKKEFDWKFYVSYHPDLNHVTSRQEAWDHFKCHGYFENRMYNDNSFNMDENFDWEFYVSHYPDLKHFTNKYHAWEHYVNHGINEKRSMNKEGQKTIVVSNFQPESHVQPESNYILIVMPTYNRSDYILKSIDYIKNQTYKYWRFLIIDDGSHQYHKIKFNQIKEKYKNDDKMIFMENDINCQVAKTLNKGIQYFLDNEQYKYLTWISDDNEYYPNFLNDLVLNNTYFKYTAYDIQELDGSTCTNSKNYTDFNDILNNFNGCASFMWTKEAIQKNGFYDETVAGCEDFEYLLRTFKQNESECMFSTISTMKYVRHPSSLMEQKRLEIMETKENIIKKHKVTVSIVMAYYNRKPQTLETLHGFERIYAGKYNFEVVIVDDNSNEENRLEEDIKQFSFPINLIVISAEEKGDRVNPCTAYNKGFKQAKGDIIIIQNPECYHVGNIIEHTIMNLTEQDYFSYSCYTANSHDITDKLLKSNSPYELIKNKEFDNLNFNLIDLSWYNHPTIPERNVGYHFCSSIYKSKLDLIGGFDEKFAEGYCFDDDELLLSIKYNLQLDIKIVHPDENCFVINQFNEKNIPFNIESVEDTNPIKIKWLKNKQLFEEMKNYHESKQFNYPKLLHLYWDGSPLSFLNLITILSFNEYHKFWKINVFIPTNRNEKITWSGNEQKIRYNGRCYFHKLYNIPNVLIHNISLEKIGFYNDASEVIKSDYFRYYILSKHGGIWSDFDIIYTSSVEDKMNFKENSIIFNCTGYHDLIEKKNHLYIIQLVYFSQKKIQSFLNIF